MNKINKLPILLILMILGIGMVGLVIPSNAVIQTQKAFVMTDKTIYDKGNPIKFTLTNIGKPPISISSDTPISIIDTKNGNTIYSGTIWCNPGEVCATVYWALTLNQWQSYTFTWNQKTDQVVCIPEIQCPSAIQVPSGIYYGILDGFKSNIFKIR